jgi:hypothetical protein
VQTLTHDGSGGDGQHAWDLISRNGQDIESGVYLFTVEWPAGSADGAIRHHSLNLCGRFRASIRSSRAG